jgi:membrane protein YdbS with pleckstrin-like domain
MNEIITENNYPIQKVWIWKSILAYIPSYLLVIAFFVLNGFIVRTDKSVFQSWTFLVIVVLGSIFHIGVIVLRRANFHYSIEDNFLTLNQGILSKQQRHIPYGVIQNIFVKQDLFDRLFGIASLAVENAAQGAGYRAVGNQKVFGIMSANQQTRTVDTIGFSGNKVSIPGLLKEDAETLKQMVLQKMKENPIEDSQSGL